MLTILTDYFVIDESNFSALGDVFAIILCVMLVFLFTITYVSKGKRFHIFQAMIGMLFIAACSDLGWHAMVVDGGFSDTAIYILHFVCRMAVLSVLFFYCYYTIELIHLEPRGKRNSHVFIGVGLLLFVITEAIASISGLGFHRLDGTNFTNGYSLFRFTYFYFIGFCIFLLILYRKRVVTKIAYSIIAVFLICFVVLIVQLRHDQSSYTVITLTLPIIAVMYLLHSNPYESSTGAVGESGFNQRIEEAYKNNKELVFMCLRIQGFEGANTFTMSMRLEIFKYFKNIKRGVLFRVNGRLVMVFPKELNPDYVDVIKELCDAFDELFEKFRYDFKAMFFVSKDFLSKDNLYAELFDFMEPRLSYNTYYWLTDKDYDDFRQKQFVLSELEDIASLGDLDDPRVVPYCQPVYNVKAKEYDTAEALMRLKLNDKMYYPDYFIPLAEEHNYIHSLSMIILNKTCKMIKGFLEEGKKIERISVNFSMLEVRDDDFDKDILEVISNNNIPYSMIAIELTESQNEEEFELVKNCIEELKGYGIKFYLDDFGTGYSNFDRIMELPFDIIKFDRSLVIESAKDEESAYMVDTFAGMFKTLKYRVLYEGVENETDENRCIKMHAEFLQGYKYSRPIKMEGLGEFLSA